VFAGPLPGRSTNRPQEQKVAEFLAATRAMPKPNAKPSGSASFRKRGSAELAVKNARPSWPQESLLNLRGHAPPTGERKLHAVCHSLGKTGQLACNNCGISNRVKAKWPLAGPTNFVQALIESFRGSFAVIISKS